MINSISCSYTAKAVKSVFLIVDLQAAIIVIVEGAFEEVVAVGV